MTAASSGSAASKQLKGWDRIVAQLTQVTDRQAFLRGMLDLQCKIVAAEYGGMWVMGPGNEAQLAEVWPPQLVQAPEGSAVIKLLGEAAKSGFDKAGSHILKLEPDAGSGVDRNLSAHVFVTPLRVGGKVAAVSTVVAETHDPQVLQATAPLRELAAGLYEGFEAKLDAASHRADAERVRKSLAILAVAQEGEGFEGACLNLVNELARSLRCTRVSIGWVKGNTVKLVAMSDTEELKRQSDDAAHLEMAMAECLDQQQPIVYPVPRDAEPLLANAVVHAHRKVNADHPNRHILTLPLRQGEEWIGALLLERTDEAFDVSLVQQLQLVVDVLSPHLQDRRTSDKWLIGHAWASVKWAAKYLVGPKHVGWKLLGLLIAGLLIYFFLGTWNYKVDSDFTLEAEQRRIIPAPYDGQIRRVLVMPGDTVQAGTVLAELDTTELRLQLVEAMSERNVAAKEKDKATAEGKIAEAQQAQANYDKLTARINLLQYRIDHAALKAPIDGKVLQGYWHDKIGGVVQIGEVMFEVAPLDQVVAVLKVDERDIEFFRMGQTGVLSTKGAPEKRVGYTIERIVPLAGPVEGTNVFEVRARLEEPQDWLLPGMAGIAATEVGPKRICWVATHRVVDTARLWLWWW